MERSLIEGVLLPGIGNFQSYAGTVELSSTNFVWLRHDDRTLTIHDRALIATQPFKEGDRVAISYQYGADGKAVQVKAGNAPKTSSVRERFSNLVSDTRTALESAALQLRVENPGNLTQEPAREKTLKGQESTAPLAQANPESTRNESSREGKSPRVIQPEPDHEPDEPGMDT